MICLQNQHTIAMFRSTATNPSFSADEHVPVTDCQHHRLDYCNAVLVGLPFYKLHCSRLNIRSPCWCTTWECIWDHGFSSLIYQVDGHCVLPAPIACCQALHLLVAGRSQLLVHVSGMLCQRRLSSSSVTDVVLSASQEDPTQTSSSDS